ncbi:hypothetical protein [Variovorax sp. tm]|uniref:hypothetical protein n=1 Tax=Variovorax atrisoli TaxID=3394203 RepID=UPI003A8064F8
MQDKPLSYIVGNLFGRLPVAVRAAFAIAVVAGAGFIMMSWASQASQPSSIVAPLASTPSQPERSQAQIKADKEINIVLAGARWLKESMKKPETFELINATMLDGRVICYEYRARNSFNDRRTERYVISDDVSSSKPKDWNRLCAGKSGTDYTHVRAMM